VKRSWFQSSRAIAALNTLAVGLGLAGMAASVIVRILDNGDNHSPQGWIVAVPTLVLGTTWAWGLRSRRQLKGTSIRVGWLASVPLASLNAGVSCTMLVAPDWPVRGELSTIVGPMLAGMTFGAIIWVPALIATLVCFGLPILWAQRAAAKRLVGEERGEQVVGLAVLVISVVGVGVHVDHLTLGVSACGMLAGGAATLLAFARSQRRGAFVSQVEAGNVAGYRVESTSEGRALVRMEPAGPGYRVADFDVEVIELDAPYRQARRAE